MYTLYEKRQGTKTINIDIVGKIVESTEERTSLILKFYIIYSDVLNQKHLTKILCPDILSAETAAETLTYCVSQLKQNLWPIKCGNLQEAYII